MGNIEDRREHRFDHVYITIKVEFQGRWEWVKAFDWNRIGFNFYFEEKIPDGTLCQFKKGLERFEGSIRWQRWQVDNRMLLEMALNLCLYREINRRHGEVNPDLLHEMALLVRQVDAVELKAAALKNHFGVVLTAEEIKKIIEENTWNQLGQYGVEVQGDQWLEIVKRVHHQSEAIKEFEETAARKFGGILKSR